jgi:hypothetical protein
MSKLLDQVRGILRTRHYSYRTENNYVEWILQYIRFHNITHPKEMGAAASFGVFDALGCGEKRHGFDAKSVSRRAFVSL